MNNIKTTASALLLAMLLITSGLFAQFAGGTGTETDPYQITTPAHLNSVRNYLGESNAGKHFKLMNDIDLTAYLSSGGAGYSAWGASGWLPIGYLSFFGNFNGNNHKISGLKINRPNTSASLFSNFGIGSIVKNFGIEISLADTLKGHSLIGCLSSSNQGTVTDCYAIGTIAVKDINGIVGILLGSNNGIVTNCHSIGIAIGGNSVGGLIGDNNNGTITNCYFTGTVRGTFCIGGLVGVNNNDGVINNSYTAGTVTGTGNDVGGLVGSNYFGNINNSYSTALINGADYAVGGLAGENQGTVSNSHATGNVIGSGSYVGGLLGGNNGNVTNCYATGTATGTEQIGGFAGYNDSTISKSYATGSVIGSTEDIAGFVGQNDGDISNCYARGASNGNIRVAGLVGYNYGKIIKSYATGASTGTQFVGGLVGRNSTSGVVNTSYWDTETTGQAASAGSDPSFGKATAEMKIQSTFIDWDFVTVWTINSSINNGYPHLIDTPVGIANTTTSKTQQIVCSNYPNPFNPVTTISFALPNSSNIKLAVMNTKGETVKILANGNYQTGNHSLSFDGSGLNSGVYFYRLVTQEKTIIKKMMLIK